MQPTPLFRILTTLACMALLVLPAAAGPGPDASWRIEIVDEPGYGGPGISLVLDNLGRPHIAYGSQAPGNLSGLRYAAWDGAAWQIELVDDDMSPGWNTPLALDTAGRPHIAYHDGLVGLRYTWHDGSSWISTTVDSGLYVGKSASLALNASDEPCMTYSDETSHTVKYAQYVSPTWEITTVVTLLYTGQLVSVDMALDAADHPHLCYYAPVSTYDSVLDYAHFDGTAWHTQTVDADITYNGQECAIAVDTRGWPRIAYKTAFELRYAVYDGAVWHTTVVGGDAPGQHIALALDAGDLPRIAYPALLMPNYALRYAAYDGTDWQIESVEVTQTGRFEDTALALGGAGQPHIAYLDLYNSNLKYATAVSSPLPHQVFLPLVRR